MEKQRLLELAGIVDEGIPSSTYDDYHSSSQYEESYNNAVKEIYPLISQLADKHNVSEYDVWQELFTRLNQIFKVRGAFRQRDQKRKRQR